MKIIEAIKQRLAQNKRRKVTIKELERLSDRELSDIGITRYDIHRLVQ